MRTRRVWFLVNIAITVALVPALFVARDHGSSKAVSVLQTLPVAATAAPGSDAVVMLGSTDAAESTTTTSTAAAPVRSTTSTAAVRRTVVTAAAAKPKPAPKPAAKPATTTTTTATPRPKSVDTGHSETGKGSWYDHQPGVCAHKTLPFGTVVTVTDTDNGRSVTCTVGDRGPFVDGWVIDLNPREFTELAPQSSGVINVRLTW